MSRTSFKAFTFLHKQWCLNKKKAEHMASRKGTADLQILDGSDHFGDSFVHGRTSTEVISEHVCVKL